MQALLLRLVLIAALSASAGLHAAERIPPVPPQYFNDYAGLVSAATASELNLQLEQYERESSNQLLVAIYPQMESGSSVEDYTVRVAQAWRIGQKGKSNGAVLFAFMQEHQLYIQVGYGLEATMTDAIASQIVQRDLKPAFRAGVYDRGLRAAVQSMIAATKGEYTGTGRTQAEADSSGGRSPFANVLLVIIVVVFIALNAIRQARNPRMFMNPRRSGGIFLGGGGFSGGGGGFGGGGGGFSGGGGGFGGGGAGGSW